MSSAKYTAEFFNKFGHDNLPGHLGIVITAASSDALDAEMDVRPALLAPNGYLHAGSVVSLADTCCGYGCYANLPEGQQVLPLLN